MSDHPTMGDVAFAAAQSLRERVEALERALAEALRRIAELERKAEGK